jgi:predicted permease
MKTLLRTFTRSPGLALGALVCAAVGVAATTAVTALVSAATFRPLPFPAADRMVRIWLVDDEARDPRVSVSIPELRDLETNVRSFDAFLGTARSRLVALFGTRAERMRGEGVTRDYFTALGLRPSLGRVLDAGDFVADAPRVIVISARTWMQHYGGDPQILGRTFRTESDVFTIVGVAPTWFEGTVEDDVVEFWMPLQQYVPAHLINRRDGRSAWAIGRLRPGVSLEAAEAEVKALVQSLATQFPDDYRGLRVRLEPMGENWRGRVRTGSVILLAAAVLLLLIASFNVAGLLAARALDRRREMAVRAALGAERRHLIGQLLLEAVLLAGVGGLIGAIAAPYVLDAFLAMSPIRLPTYVTLEPDAMWLTLAAVTIILSGLVAGIAPALVASRVAPADALKQSSRGSVGRTGERRWGGILVAGETALTLVLLVGGSLLLMSYRTLATFDPGYRIEGVSRLAVTISRLDVSAAGSLPAFYSRLRAELEQQPGVERVGLVSPTLPPWDGHRTRIRYPGLEEPFATTGLMVGAHLADPGLLPMLGVAIVAGRNFESTDGGTGDPPVIVSRSIAGRLGGVQAALGRSIALVGDDVVPAGQARVVGVAENIAYDGLGEQGTGRYIHYGDASDRVASRDDVYLPLVRIPMRPVSIGVTTGGDAAALIEPLGRALSRVAPSSAVHWTGTMEEEVGREYSSSRFYALLVNAFSLSALALTTVGVFAVLSHVVARRTGEIGLRRALGGTRVQIAGYVARIACTPLVVGIGLGLAAAFLMSRWVGTLLYGVGALDLTAFGAATLILLCVAAVATAIPARRAAAIDPMIALRED